MAPRSKFSIVVEQSPLLQAQAWIWVICLHELGKIEYEHMYVHTVGDFRNEFTNWLELQGVNIKPVEPFDPTNPYCNKLAQLSTFTSLDDFDYVWLMDCDTAVISLHGLKLDKLVHAKVVDYPNPPYELLSTIFHAAGLGDPLPVPTSFKSGDNEHITDHNNCNGGLYILSKGIIRVLAELWISYVRWSLSNIDLYKKKYSRHADQVSFALAMKKLGLKVGHLGIEWNLPLHVNLNSLGDVSPRILHFHSRLNEHLKLKQVNVPRIDEGINKVNKVISEFKTSGNNSALFWNFRYSHFPELGSGVGSRGDTLQIKQELLRRGLSDAQTKSIIEIGCGDLQVIKDFSFRRYTGIDISEEAIKSAKRERPDWAFFCGDLQAMEIDKADIVICLDVLIHQPDFYKYKELIERMTRLCRERLIIGAYESEPTFSADFTHYYEPIRETLRRTNQFSEIKVLGVYRDTSLVMASLKAVKMSR